MKKVLFLIIACLPSLSYADTKNRALSIDLAVRSYVACERRHAVSFGRFEEPGHTVHESSFSLLYQTPCVRQQNHEHGQDSVETEAIAWLKLGKSTPQGLQMVGLGVRFTSAQGSAQFRLRGGRPSLLFKLEF
jgi:hypothetical protein